MDVVAKAISSLGLGVPSSWWVTILLAVAWLGLLLAYSPLADRLASRLISKPPTLQSFRPIQQSTGRLIAGIVVAWILGGFVEELIFRGIVLRFVESLLATRLGEVLAAAVAICIAAAGAGSLHFYQGPRAMLIVAQLSVLLGVLFVVSGHNLWTAILCHGLYDTVGFVMFAKKKSKYSNLA